MKDQYVKMKDQYVKIITQPTDGLGQVFPSPLAPKDSAKYIQRWSDSSSII